MSMTLLPGTASTAAGTAARGAARSPEPASQTAPERTQRDSFEAHLESPDARSGSSASSSSSQTPEASGRTTQESSRDEAGETTEPDDSAAQREAGAFPAAADPLWPPLGLAGLVLSMPDPALAPALEPDSPAPARSLPGSMPLSMPSAAVPALVTGVPTAVPAATAPPTSESNATGIALEGMLQADGGEISLDSAALTDAPDGLAMLLQGATGISVARAGMEPLALAPMDASQAVGQDAFDEGFSARLGWMADQKIGHAHIRLSPDDLGTIDVRLQMDGDRIHASFSSPHVDVRQALEHSLPRLRELLGEQGFQLAHADVGQQQGGEGGNPHTAARTPVAGTGDGEPSRHEATVVTAHQLRQRGLLDAYA